MKRIIFILAATGILSQAFGYPSGEKSKATGQRTGSAISVTVTTPFSASDHRNSDMHDRNYGRRWDQDEEEKWHDNGARSFRGHWAGIEFGFNNWGFERDVILPDNLSYMTLNTTSSNCFNINFSQLNLGFSRHMGIVSGIGLNWNNYRFQNDNSIAVGLSGTIAEFIPDNTMPVKKSKFSDLYLNVPVLLEIQIPAGFSNHLNIAAGVIGGIKINAWTKVVYEDKEKSRINGDYNLNLLRGGVHARVGYENFMIFGTYYLTPWFQEMKGPEGLNLEPFEIGIAFTFND